MYLNVCILLADICHNLIALTYIIDYWLVEWNMMNKAKIENASERLYTPLKYWGSNNRKYWVNIRKLKKNS